MRISKFGARRVALTAVCVVVSSAAFLATGAAPVSARPAFRTGTVQDITDFDSYSCPQSGIGFVGFEDLGTDSTLGSASVPGLSFSADHGAHWTVRNFDAGAADGEKFPAGPLSSEQTHWSTATGANTATINLTGGTASHFSMLVSDYSKATLTAFSSTGKKLGSTPTHKIPDGRHMSIFQLDRPLGDIGKVTLTVNGHDFAIDSICTDAPQVPTPQLTLSSADGAPGSTITVDGSGFASDENVDISVDGHLDAPVHTDGTGAFHTQLVISELAAPGPATIVAQGAQDEGTANFSVHTDWRQNGFNASRASFNRAENQLDPADAANLVNAWPDADAGLTGGRPTAPIVVDGVVYTAAADGFVYAFNDVTGARVWACVPGTSPCATGSGMPHRRAKVVALRGAPSYDNGMLFVSAADGFLYALDPTNGKEIWGFDTGHPLNRAPLTDHGVVYVATDAANGTVFAIDEATGTPRWKKSLQTPVHSTLATNGKLVFAGTDSGLLYALNTKAQGAVVWTGKTKQRIRSSAAVANGLVVVGSQDGTVYAWNTDSTGTPKPVWKRATGQPVGAGIAIGQGGVFVGTESGTFDELSLSDGHPIDSFISGGSITTRAAVANGVVAFSDPVAQKIFVLNQSSFTSALFTADTGLVASDITLTNGAIYVGSTLNQIQKFALP
ncbi:MAG TPA: PQQ-binding-like beta-propeller repeat protein [Acidimicrobiia bacterium]|nr:PQQ-binding-like beta-propeller repeat protein [Acidimicrobiia bacterium]